MLLANILENMVALHLLLDVQVRYALVIYVWYLIGILASDELTLSFYCIG